MHVCCSSSSSSASALVHKQRFFLPFFSSQFSAFPHTCASLHVWQRMRAVTFRAGPPGVSRQMGQVMPPKHAKCLLAEACERRWLSSTSFPVSLASFFFRVRGGDDGRGWHLEFTLVLAKRAQIFVLFMHFRVGKPEQLSNVASIVWLVRRASAMAQPVYASTALWSWSSLFLSLLLLHSRALKREKKPAKKGFFLIFLSLALLSSCVRIASCDTTSAAVRRRESCARFSEEEVDDARDERACSTCAYPYAAES